MAESIVTLRVEARNAIASLNKTSQATRSLSKNANGATRSLAATSTAVRGLGSAIATSLGPLLTLGAAFATVSNAVGTFTARERDVEILRQGLLNLGEGTVALNELQIAADKLGNQTLFNQEEFTRGFNLLTSFRNIGVDSYSRVAQAAADIAQVNQVDVSTSFMQLAKALQDPERNLSNLNRSGIAFTKTQTELIKELMKTGKTAEAHAMILSIVEESYNGLAQAAGEGLAGDVDALGETFRDFSETLGKALEPALIASVKGLTELIKGAEALIKSPLSQTIGIFSGIALAAKGLPVLLTAISVGLQKIAFAGGLATIALNAIPFVAIATGAGLLTTALIKTNQEKKKFNDLVNQGAEDEVTKALQDQSEVVTDLQNKVNELSGRNKKAAQRKLEEAKLDKKMLEGRLNTLKSDELINNKLKERVTIQQETTEAITETNEAANIFNGSLDKSVINIEQAILATDALKDKFMDIGQGIEDGIVSGLTDAVIGTKTLAEAATGVLNNLKRKLVEVAMQRAVSGIGNFFGNALSGIFGGGKKSNPFLGGPNAFKFTSDLSPTLGFFANGGRPPVGRASIVGERGPELFVPRTAGTIIPNNEIGGGNTTNNMITVNVDASGTSVQGNGSEADQLGQLIGSIVQATLIQESRSGGLLNK